MTQKKITTPSFTHWKCKADVRQRYFQNEKYTGHETAPLGKHVANNLKDICRRFMAIMLPDLAYRVVAAPFFPAWRSRWTWRSSDAWCPREGSCSLPAAPPGPSPVTNKNTLSVNHSPSLVTRVVTYDRTLNQSFITGWEAALRNPVLHLDTSWETVLRTLIIYVVILETAVRKSSIHQEMGDTTQNINHSPCQKLRGSTKNINPSLSQ